MFTFSVDATKYCSNFDPQVGKCGRGQKVDKSDQIAFFFWSTCTFKGPPLLVHVGALEKWTEQFMKVHVADFQLREDPGRVLKLFHLWEVTHSPFTLGSILSRPPCPSTYY